MCVPVADEHVIPSKSLIASVTRITQDSSDFQAVTGVLSLLQVDDPHVKAMIDQTAGSFASGLTTEVDIKSTKKEKEETAGKMKQDQEAAANKKAGDAAAEGVPAGIVTVVASAAGLEGAESEIVIEAGELS